MLKLKVKAGGIRNLTDARYFAAKEVEWLGYCLDPTAPEYLPPNTMQAIREWVGGVLTLGEFGFVSGEELLAAAEQYQLDAVQVGVFAGAEDLLLLQGRVQVLREIIVEPEADAAALQREIARLAPLVHATILSFQPNRITWSDIEAGRPFGVQALRELCAASPILIGMDLDAAAVADLLESVQPYGLAVQGGEEEKTGFKSFEALDEVLDTLEILV
ncbi:MAG: hypothetical protein KF852_16670 [Saprospiraceae bacterium]|nr:hypothetical protein [Saprospiraceae bacterium]